GGATMSLAIHGLLHHPTPEAVDAFVRGRTFPIVEGPSVTFVWRGEADAVNLRHWIYGLPSSQALARLAGTDLWWLIVEIPPCSRVEYKLELVRGGGSELVADPLNPNFARDPFGGNSVVHSHGYQAPAWIQPDPESRPGALEELLIGGAAFGERRRVLLYFPARFRRSRRYPLVFVHDGLDYLQYTGLKTILDNLIHPLAIPDMVVAFANSPNRLHEYANDERHARWVTEEAFPFLEGRFPLVCQ